MATHKRPLALATASLQDVISCGHAISGAATREDKTELEAIRVKAHDHLDAYLDQMTEAGVAARNLAEG
jgi:hypothetical protein